MSDPAKDLEILQPDVTLEIQGETVTVREFTFLEGIQLVDTVKPVVEDLAAYMLGGVDLDDEVSLGILSEIMARRTGEMLKLMSQATGKSEDWITALPDADGQLLLLTFWQVNSHFFVRRLVMRTIAHQPETSASEKSSQH